MNSVDKFIYKPEEVTFETYFRRYESISEKDCEEWPDEKKFLLGKYINFILLRQPGEVTFRETIQILMKIFGELSTLFNTSWQCLNLTKKDCEDYMTFASTFNRYCERFQLNEITPDMFKCLIFIQGLTSSSEKEMRTRLLTKLEQDQKITLQSLAEGCQCILNLRADTTKIEERDISNIHSIKKSQGKKN